MLAIGATLRKWTPCLLLLASLSACVSAQVTNDTTATTTTTSSIAGSATRTPSYADALCPSRTINYITHTLPQQCLRTDWAASGTEGLDRTAATTPTFGAVVPVAGDESGTEGVRETTRPLQSPVAEETDTPKPVDKSDTSNTQPEAELETVSPLDNANFLSFEEWKKKNLAQAGQSPENVGQGRAASSEQRARRRPVNVNALDSLGEEGEIEIDFSGFGHPSEGDPPPSRSSPGPRGSNEATTATDADGKAAPSSWALSKDAGKTCKERFNYASFDCAATVVKTNPKAKSTSSILVENKDSYMLNECSAENKFIIVELCDDILVDTIVLANYEFFSSMFRHVRVSVSDRYPVKMDRWHVLGTFEARNSRDLQPFLITEPQIWARYLRIEFLTHYGNEFYCPMSLLRVHGTTMLEQFRREEEQARGDDDFAEPLDTAEGVPVQTAVPADDESGKILEEKIPVQPGKEVVEAPTQLEEVATDKGAMESRDQDEEDSAPPVRVEIRTREVPTDSDTGPSDASVPESHPSAQPSEAIPAGGNSAGNEAGAFAATSEKKVPTSSSNRDPSAYAAGTNAKSNGSTSVIPSKASTATNETVMAPSNTLAGKATNVTNGSQAHTQSRSSSQTQPVAATPTTQESFFKSIHKRLQYLEANSTLSLQYIEEQSRILRDAFVKVEKSQLQKTEKFLNHLNSTVMQELKSYRNMYDQLWQSTILELEGMKERQRSEIGEIGARLSMVADELVWQKRMAVVQSTLLLLCLGLVLFVRSGSLGSQIGTTYSSFFEPPPHSPATSGLMKRRRTFKNMWRSDTSAGLSDRSGHLSDAANAVSDTETYGRRSPINVEYSPPTPITPGSASLASKKVGFFPDQPCNSADESQGTGFATPAEEAYEDEARRIQVLETQSGPATPRGSCDNRPSWEEVKRAVDLLKAEEQGQAGQREQALKRDQRRRRSPLIRTESCDGADDDSPEDDCLEGLFTAG